MYQKNAKWLLLGLLSVVLLVIINLSLSQYAETVENQITLNIRKPSYTIEFYSNDGESEEYVTQDFIYGTPQNLTANSFTKDGNSFKEWNTKADGSGISFSNEAEVNNLSEIDGDIFELYAIWEAQGTYTVIHKKMDLDGINYTVAEVNVINAGAGEVVTPIPKNYPGFIVPDRQTVIVEGDGSTTVTYLYERKQIKIKIY